MSDCPECGMRDDDWFLCRREPCAINKTKRDGDRIADLERQIAELRAELSKRQTLYTNSSEAAAWRRTYWQDRAEAAEAENARLRALSLKDEVETWDIEATAEEIARSLSEVKGGRFHGPAYSVAKAGALAALQRALTSLSRAVADRNREARIRAAAPSDQGGDRG